jgi:anti-sigma factor RsiW
MRNQEDAEDMVQESYLKAFRFFASFQGMNCRAWFLQIVRNTCYTALGARKLRQKEVPIDEENYEIEDPSPLPPASLIKKATSLRRKIQSALPAARSSAKHQSGRRSFIPWFSLPLALAAAFTVVLGLVFLNQGGMLDRSRGNALVEEVVSSHVRSLLATHLLDIPSIDQHTVKPWFDGKLKFSPPVLDFTTQGFRLIGGRLDYINGREVAALVYQRNKHIINLFILPLESDRTEAVQSFAKDGYNVLHWDRGGFEFWAVSDVNAGDLRAFADLEMNQA